MDSRRIRLGLYWIHLTCREEYVDELEGDLFEVFHYNQKEIGQNRAKWKFFWGAIFSLRFYRMNKIKIKNSNNMLGNYITVTLRHSRRHKIFSAVSLLSLILGFTTCIYIGLFIKNELSYDRFHANGDNIYRTIKHDKEIDELNAGLSSRYGEMLASEFSDIKVFSYGNDPVKFGKENPILIESFFWADSTLFDLFSFKLIYGSEDALKHKNSVVLTESLSKRLFGDKNPVGEFLPTKIYDGDQQLNMMVTAVLEDVPENSHIRFEALGSMSNSKDLYGDLLTSWGFNWLQTYVMASEDYMKIINEEMQEVMIKNRGENFDQFTLEFQPLYDVHLRSGHIDSSRTTGDIRNVEIFTIIGILVLVIAIFNYINLATARTLTRSKEVGLRKSIGANRGNIIAQFLTESALLSITALVVSIIIVLITLDIVNISLGVALSLQSLGIQEIILSILAVLIIALVSGIYPAMLMSKLHLDNIKSSGSEKTSSITRKVLVISQYSITILLIAVSLLVLRQYSFMRNYDLGFEKEQLINMVVDDRQAQKSIGAIKNDILQLSDVVAASATGETLPGAMNNSWNYSWEGKEEDDQGYTIDIVGIDKDYFDVLGLEIIEGTGLTKDYSVDSAMNWIINETAKELTGWEEIAGKEVSIAMRNRTVAGVVQDYHITSLHENIKQTAYFIAPPGFRVSPDNILIRVNTKDYFELIKDLENIWKKYSAEPFISNFVDEEIDMQYAQERRFIIIINFFTSIAVLVALIGLFGLINFQARQRTKEVSVRKILGAGEFSLIRILSSDFIVLYSIALVIAIPIAYLVGTAWLSNYVIRIDYNFDIFVLATFLGLIISMGVVLSQVIQVIKVNPANVLKE